MRISTNSPVEALVFEISQLLHLQISNSTLEVLDNGLLFFIDKKWHGYDWATIIEVLESIDKKEKLESSHL
ncbi:MAG: hypothetical protein ACI93R_002574 [Flavobacteriales bacterium]|jgi:hypothetical protein